MGCLLVLFVASFAAQELLMSQVPLRTGMFKWSEYEPRSPSSSQKTMDLWGWHCYGSKLSACFLKLPLEFAAHSLNFLSCKKIFLDSWLSAAKSLLKPSFWEAWPGTWNKLAYGLRRWVSCPAWLWGSWISFAAQEAVGRGGLTPAPVTVSDRLGSRLFRAHSKAPRSLLISAERSSRTFPFNEDGNMSRPRGALERTSSSPFPHSPPRVLHGKTASQLLPLSCAFRLVRWKVPPGSLSSDF